MMKNIIIKSLVSVVMAAMLCACAKPAPQTDEAQDHPENQILLKSFAPVNVNNIPQTYVEKAKFPVYDMHSHDYAANKEEVAQWVKNMDACGIARSTIHHCNWIGEPFEVWLEKYADYRDRFDMWCCFDYSHYGQEDFSEYACAELERYHALGAVGVGELGDKGLGDLYARPVPGEGIHIDDPALKPLIAKAGELGMPISIHIAEPYWMYLPLDSTNDGLINGARWHVDTTVPGCYDYDQLMVSFENAVRENPGTIFIACHYLNMNQDLPRLAALLDKYPNLYIDISGRFGEAAQTPRATRAFLINHQDRIFYGTDNGMDSEMYRYTFRILETEDEHIYHPEFGYHWYYSAFYLPDEVLEKIYHLNAEKLMGKL